MYASDYVSSCCFTNHIDNVRRYCVSKTPGNRCLINVFDFETASVPFLLWTSEYNIYDDVLSIDVAWSIAFH